MRAFYLLALIGIGSLLVFVAPAFAQTPSLRVALEPGGAVAEAIPLGLPSDATSATLTVYVSQPPEISTELKNVRLSVALADENRLPAPNVSVNFTATAGVTLTVPANGAPARAALTVANVAITGTLSGVIIAEADGKIYRTGTRLIVTRYPAPHIALAGATDAGAHIVETRAQFTRTLYLEATNSAPAKLRVEVNHLIGRDGVQVPLQWTLGGKPPAEIEIAGLTALPLELMATLPVSGTYTSSISLIYAGGRKTIPLTLTYTPLESRLKLVGVGADGKLALTQTTAAFDQLFFVESANRLPTTLRAEIEPLRGPDGVPVPARLAPSEQPIPGLASLPLRVQATLPLTGTYHSAISLIYDGKRETTPLVVTRVRPAAVELFPLDIARGETGNTALVLTLQEKTGVTTTVGLPVFTALYRKVDQNKYQAVVNNLQTFDVAGDIALSKVTLAPGETRQVRLNLNGVAEPGEYTGVLRVSGADTQAADQPVTLLIKQTIGIAAFWIFVGIAVSTGIRWLTKQRRPQLTKQLTLRKTINRVQNLVRQIGDPTRAERAVLEQWLYQLREQYDLVTLDSAQDIAPANTAVADKLGVFVKWINVRRNAATLDDPTARAALLAQTDALEPDFGAGTAADLEPKIKDFQKQVENARVKFFGAQVEKFRAAVAQRNVPSASAALKQQLADLGAALDTLGKTTTAETLPGALKQFETARKQYVEILAADLQAQITDNPAKDAVTAKLAACRQAADVNAAIAEYEAAYGWYLTGLFEQLGKILPPELIAVRAALDQAKPQIAEKKFDAAWQAYQTAQTQYETWKQAQAGRGSPAKEIVLPLAPSVALPTAPPSAREAIRLGAVPTQETTLPPANIEIPTDESLPSLAALRRSITWNEAIIFGAVTIVAVAVGVNELWVKSAIWGGWSDYLIALLWGLGLHQVGSLTFENVAKLGEKFAA